MKTIVTTFIFFLLSTVAMAQTRNNQTMEQRIAAIEDKMAIKYVVDEFSNLADTKDIDKQVLLFTEDGEVRSTSNGQTNVLKGRQELQQAFSGFLANFHTVYHQNGQQTIEELTDNTAKATSYCRVILVGKQGDKEMKTALYAIYNDNFVKEGGKWLIKQRTSNFVYREVEEVK